ncbi:MAG: TIGR01212 family radical SAM protein [Bacilli bacterium]|nr:TIGR01212 family radical SAM protein [Bacilli bacterium]
MFKYTLDNKRYHTLNYHVKNKYKCKVVKISLNAGFTCPNIDGTKGYGGCIYCSKSGSGDFGGDINKSLTEQFNEIKQKIDKKWPNSKYIAYFQARTNTYAPVSILKEKYESILKLNNVIGLAIATRADAITEECLNYLTDLNKRTNLTIELGLQTIHNNTSKLINRCHTLKEFEDTYKKLKERNIKIVVHIINGLPYETKNMMLDTVKYLNTLKIDGIKIHMLNIIKDTSLAKLYKKDYFHLLTKEEYIDIVINQLELLDPKVVIHRITSDPDPKDLIAPTWLTKKFCLLNDIDKEMNKRNTYQGKKIKS